VFSLRALAEEANGFSGMEKTEFLGSAGDFYPKSGDPVTKVNDRRDAAHGARLTIHCDFWYNRRYVTCRNSGPRRRCRSEPNKDGSGSRRQPQRQRLRQKQDSSHPKLFRVCAGVWISSVGFQFGVRACPSLQTSRRHGATRTRIRTFSPLGSFAEPVHHCRAFILDTEGREPIASGSL
jgi:hypothetical protein